jgi:short-subunit dehydrogenase
MASDSGRALVTGASAGIGTAFAEAIARRGQDLVLTARRTDRLEQIAARLRAESDVEVEVITADLTQESDVVRLEEALSSDDRLTLLVNNAGFGGYRPFVELDPGDAENILAVHVGATIRLTHAALPGMVERGNGSVINIASMLAYSGLLPAPPLPFRATYAAAKSFVITFSQLLAGEVAHAGVRVMACCPGLVSTEFHDVEGMDVSHMPQMTAEDVVSAALKGLELGETICVPGLEDVTMLEEALQAQMKVMFVSAGPGATGELASRYRQEPSP